MLLQTIVRIFVNMETTGNKIKRLRKSKGLSLMELAKMVEIPDSARSQVEPGKTKKISDTALSKLETGKTTSITIDLGKSIAKALGISFNELFDIEVTSNYLEIEGFQNKILDLEREIKLRDKIIADYSDMFDNYKEQIEFVKKFYSETGMVVQFMESAIDKIEGAPTEMKEEMKALLHAHLNNTKSPE